MCKHCSIEGRGTFKDVEVKTNGIYEFKCDYGHENISILQHHSFQLLYDLGIKTLLDGYTREAATSFSVSIERFHEYCIDLFLHDLPEENKRNTWKYVSSSSERQLGAFYFLYLYEIKAVPKKVSGKWEKFRNDVIHKGNIPSNEKAFEYAKYVFDYINEVLDALYTKYIGQNRFFAFMNKRYDEVKEKYPSHIDSDDPTTIQGPTFIEIFPIDENGPDRSEFIRSFQQNLDLFKGMSENQNSQGVKGRLW